MGAPSNLSPRIGSPAVLGVYSVRPSLIETNRWAWSRLRETVMRRDGNRCRIGGPSCLVWASEVDHIIPRIAGGTDALSNLRSVCKPCHKRRLVDAICGTSESTRFSGGPYSYGRPRKTKDRT
jgi:5-methylcytosine-specific restriction endonuclease McrA